VKITKLILSGYKRLFLNDITRIEYTPQAKVQILLGQNGCGKSSLLEQLTAEPPNLKKDFRANGSKEIHITHNDGSYVLYSSLETGHSFKFNGDELNDNNKISTQATLVEYHFGITNQSQQVLLGKKTFTNMSYSERKRWITEMSSIDYSYAVSVFNSLKARHRDIVGGIKLLQNNIVKVTTEALPDDVVRKLEYDKKHIVSTIDHLFTIIESVENISLDESMQKVSRLVSRIQKHTNNIETPITELKEQNSEYNIKITMVKDHLAKLYGEIEKVNNVISGEDIDRLNKQLVDLNKSIETILKSNIFSDIKDISSVCDYIFSNYTDITGVLGPLSEYIDIDITKTRLDNLISIKDSYFNRLGSLANDIIKLEERITHMDECSGVENTMRCPNCDHMWNPGFDKLSYEDTKKKLIEIIDKQTKMTVKYDGICSDLLAIETVRSILVDFFRYFNYNDNTKIILSYIRDSKEYCKSGYTGLANIFEQVCSELTSLSEVVNLIKKRDIISETITNNVATEKLKIDTVRNKLNEDISELRIELAKLIKYKENIIKTIQTKESYIANVTELDNAVKLVYKAKKSKMSDIKNELLRDAIHNMRNTLMDIDDKLRVHNECVNMLDTYQKELDNLNLREKLLTIIINSLSPSSGLIARSVSSFLNKFILDMNEIIGMVWGYQMEILTCDLGEDDLDYKFKVLVNNDEVIEDISKTSSSMQEMIDLVFKIVFCRYMGYIGYPLILDELGRTFDSAHRITVYEALERTISQDFSQVFMVSHFESMYGRFGLADISILGTTGVDTNTIESYNDVMLIS
jgi:hypothetical protein